MASVDGLPWRRGAESVIIGSMNSLPAIVLVLALAGAACSKATSPATPTPTATSVDGKWTGDLSVLGTLARMTWTLTQTDTTVTGPVLVQLPTGTVLLNGTLSGTLSGSTLVYTIAVSPGGIPFEPACTGQLAGGVAVSISTASTLTGSYNVVSSTCSTPFSSGNFTLTKTS